ncbi:hypothetical protein ACOMHN_014663 [Nucella lapillus]
MSSKNVFKFDGAIYQQVFGTAMGTPMAPAVANLVMAWLEGNVLARSPVCLFGPRRVDFLQSFARDNSRLGFFYVG